MNTRSFRATSYSILFLFIYHLSLLAAVVSTNAPPATNDVAEIAIFKTASTTNAAPGDIIQFYISAYNSGPSAASNIVVQESLPPGLTFTGSSNYTFNGFYDPPSGQWFITNLASGASAFVNLSAQFTGSGSVTNTATLVSSSPGDPNTTNNSSSVVINASGPPMTNAVANLSISKMVDQPNAMLGSMVHFYIGLYNQGPAAASNITVQELFPSGLKLSGPPGYSPNTFYDPSAGIWYVTNLQYGASAQLTLGAQVESTGFLTNTAAITGSSPGETNSQNNSASATVYASSPQQTNVVADLAITKAASSNSVSLGQRLVFFLTLSNAGPDTVTNSVTVSDVLPAGFQYVSDNSGPGYGSYSAGLGQWTVIPGPAAASVTLAIAVAATNTGIYTNTAVIQIPTGVTDNNPANDTDSATVSVTATGADLAITKAVMPATTNVGGSVQFTVTVRNNGPAAATNIVAQDVLPANYTLISSNIPPGVTFNAGAGTWNIASLSNGASSTIQLTVTTTNAGVLTNVASIVSSGTTDTNLLNNTNSAVATWTNAPSADLAALLNASTNRVGVGGSFVVQCIVTNLGPNAPTNVALQLTYPPGLVISNVFGTTGGGTFNTNTGLFQVPGSLAVNASSQVSVVFTATNVGAFNVTLAITASSLPDPNTTNNSASITINAVPVYNISGLVTDCSSKPLTNVTITLSATNLPSRTAGTSTNGAYQFAALLPGTYSLMASNSSYTFSPTNTVVTITNTNMVTNFVGLARFITGSVRQAATNGLPLPGVVIQLSGAAASTNTTDTNGSFIFTNLNAGAYTVKPLTNGFPGIGFAPTNVTITLGNLTNCAGSADFVATNPIVVLRALEAVQVIQDWENSVPLVVNKRTLVRAHLQLLSSNSPPVVVSGARVIVTSGAASTTLNPENPAGRVTVITNDAQIFRTNLNSSLYFELPPAWRTGTNVTLRFQWTNGVVLNSEPADASGDPASNGVVRISFTTVPPIPVKWLFTQWTGTNGTVHGPGTANANELRDRLLSVFPVPSVTMAPSETYVWTNNPPLSTTDNRNALLGGLLTQLQALRDRQITTNANKTHYYGVVSDVELGGLGYTPANFTNSKYATAAGSLPATPWTYGRNRHAHEIGHNLGRRHAVYRASAGTKYGDWGETAPAATPYFPYMTMSNTFAEVGANAATLGIISTNNTPTLGPLDLGTNKFVYGWDSHAGIVVDPLQTYELMGYADRRHWRWMSKYSYTNIMNASITRYSTNPAPAPAALHKPGAFAPAPVLDSYLIVRGSIALDSDTVAFDPFYSLVTSEPPVQETGNYVLQVFNSSGGLLMEIPFQPEEMFPDEDFPESDVDLGLFSIPVPVVPDMHSIIVMDGAVPIAQMTASANPPSVLVVSPVAGQVISGGTFNAQWTGSDPDGNPLTYAVEFSSDGGATWEALTIDWPGTSLQIDTSNLPGTSNALVRVVASDGFNSSMASSGAFAIPNRPPSIAIVRPNDGDLFIADQQVIFQADALDLQDGTLDGTNVVWTSSQDGTLGTGAELFLATSSLSDGRHLITATATDSLGLTNSASIGIVVSSQAVPTLAIQVVGGQAYISWPVSATNWVLESSLGLASASWSPVTATPFVVDDQETVTLNISGQAQFFRLRMQ